MYYQGVLIFERFRQGIRGINLIEPGPEIKYIGNYFRQNHKLKYHKTIQRAKMTDRAAPLLHQKHISLILKGYYEKIHFAVSPLRR